VVYGMESLDSLQAMVEEMFSEVSSCGETNAGVHYSLRDSGLPMDRMHGLGWLHRIIPIKDIHQLRISWQIPSQFQLFRQVMRKVVHGIQYVRLLT